MTDQALLFPDPVPSEGDLIATIRAIERMGWAWEISRGFDGRYDAVVWIVCRDGRRPPFSAAARDSAASAIRAVYAAAQSAYQHDLARKYSSPIKDGDKDEQ